MFDIVSLYERNRQWRILYLKAEFQNLSMKNWCFQIVVLEKTLESPLDYKEITSVNPKGNNSEYSLGGLMLKLQYFAHVMWRVYSLEKSLMLEKIESKRRGWQRMKWLDSITDSMDMNLSKLKREWRTETWGAVVHGVAKSQTRLNNGTTTNKAEWTFENDPFVGMSFIIGLGF